jgi:hypothetical protein
LEHCEELLLVSDNGWVFEDQIYGQVENFLEIRAAIFSGGQSISGVFKAEDLELGWTLVEWQVGAPDDIDITRSVGVHSEELGDFRV